MPWSRLIPILLQLLLCAQVQAQEQPQWNFESIFSASYNEVAKANFNLNNNFLRTPSQSFNLDLRAEYKQLMGSHKLIFRPRFLGDDRWIQYDTDFKTERSVLGKFDLTDFFDEYMLSEKVILVGGLFVDGWGPAEFVNPTNPFFRLNTQGKNLFFKEKGQVLLKGLVNPDAQSTYAVVLQPVSNNESPPVDGLSYFPTWVFRAELQSDTSEQNVGLLFGQDFAGTFNFGEYLNFANQSSGWSVYLEAKHSKDPARYQPVAVNGFYNLLWQSQPGFSTYSVLGLRWEGRVDARLEWIFYELGYSQAEWQNLQSALTQLSPFLANNAVKFQKPGMEFLSRNWLSCSVRIPDVGPNSNWQVIARSVLSVGDRVGNPMVAGFFQTNLDIPAFDAWNLFADHKVNFGQSNTELTSAIQYSISLGARYAW